MFSRYLDAFENLLRKAMAPIGPQPTPVVPAAKPPAITAEDRANHQNKRHYGASHEAERVVTRTIEQNPHHSQNLHHYKCPVCQHELGKKQFIVGHKPVRF